MNWHERVRSEFTRLGKQVDESVVEEMAQHAAAAWEAARADGESPADADAQVLALIASWCEATTGPRRIERTPLIESAPAGTSLFSGLGLDLRLAFRMLRRQPGFAAVSIALIALAIAATTSLFSVVNAVLLKPLPWAKVEGLVRVFETGRPLYLPSATPVVTNLTYRAWADDAPTTIVGMGGWSDDAMRSELPALDGPSGVELVRLARVTASLFPLLGMRPVLGWNFTDADEFTEDTVILSYGFWQERFGARPDALGQQITLGGKARTIIGVMPREFEFPAHGTRLWLPERVWPSVLTPKSPGPRGRKGGAMIQLHNAVARLKPGVTSEQAASEAASRAKVAALILASMGFDEWGGRTVVVTPMLEWMVKDVKPVLWILLTAGVLLCVAAIGNVVNMQLARATAQQREIAVRLAIGAGSGRLTRQLFVETSMIAAIGGMLGLWLTYAVLQLLPALLPEDFPRVQDVYVDTRVLTVVTTLAVLVSLVMALLPSRMARRLKLTSTLAEDGSAPVGQSLRSPAARSRAFIITGQVAVAALLLVGAALLAQSFWKHINVDRGYQPANLSRRGRG